MGNDVDMTAMLETAAKADAEGLDIGMTETPAPESETSTATETPPEAETPPPEGEKPPGDAQEPAPESGSVDQSKSKFVKERERANKTWKEINAEKEKIKAEREAFAAEKQRIEAERKKIEDERAKLPKPSIRDEFGYTAEEYEAGAEQFKKDGDIEMYWKAKEAAQKLRELGSKEQFNAEFNKHWTGLTEKHPELKDMNSETFKGVKALMEKYRFLQAIPDGVVAAFEAVQLQQRTKDFDRLADENKKLKTQLEDAQRKLGLSGGKTIKGGNGEEKPFEKMTSKEQLAYLQRAAREADGLD